MATLKNIRTVVVPSIGKLPLAENPGSFVPSGKKRTFKAGRLAEDGGFMATNTSARLDLNINLLPGVDVAQLNAIENEDVTVTLEDGEVHMMFAASAEDTVPVGEGEGKLVLVSAVSEKI